MKSLLQMMFVGGMLSAFLPTMSHADQSVFQPIKPEYQITVKTSDKGSAGTDSNITMTLIGNSKSYQVVLNPYMSGNAFERNDVDRCTLTITEAIGHPTRLTLKSDTKYAGSDWHVQYVDVRCPDGVVQRFNFNKWIEDDGRNNSLTAETPASPKPWGLYRVDVHTADAADAGTDSNIHMTLTAPDVRIGEFRATSWVSGNAWERGHTDSFVFWVSTNATPIQTVRVVSDGMYAAADWRLHKIMITDLKRNNIVEEFVYDHWITGNSTADQQVAISQSIKNMKFEKETSKNRTYTEFRYINNLGNSQAIANSEVSTFQVAGIAEVTESQESSVGSTTTISSGYAAGDGGGVESSITQEFASSLTEAGARLDRREVEAIRTQTLELKAPANTLLIAECTWNIPEDIYRPIDRSSTNVISAHVVTKAPYANPSYHTFAAGQTIPAGLWRQFKESLDEEKVANLLKSMKNANIRIEGS